MEMSVLNGFGDNSHGYDDKQKISSNNETQFATKQVDGRLSTSPAMRFDDRGPHREMAIDCPATFVGMKKEPPRYPRPLSIIQNSVGSVPKGKTPPSTLPRYQDQKSVKSSEDDRERMERIKRYQEDLAKRREAEDRMRKEQEFLRTSLRGSKKLQELEERKAKGITSTGFVNPTYLVEEEELIQQKNENNLKRGVVKPQSVMVEDVVTSVEEAKKFLPHSINQEEQDFLNRFLLSERFRKLLQVHDKIVEVTLNGTALAPKSAPFTLAVHQEALNDLDDHLDMAVAKELSYLLNKPHFKNFLLAHDDCLQLQRDAMIAAAAAAISESLAPVDPEKVYDEYLYDHASQYGEDSIKIVRIQKTAEPLGATVRNEGESVVIGRIVKGGIADKSGLLHEGDEILEINGTDVRGKSINEISDLMSCLTGVLTFLINPSPEQRIQPVEQPVMHIRAHFSYDPEEDHYIPCRELGMSFVKGDILHVLNQDDPNWWQAYREGEDDQFLAGLIPSKSFHEKRETLKQAIVKTAKENSKNKRRCNCTQKRNKKKKQQSSNFEGETEEILSYEEVTLYYPQPNRKRPIVLIGPPNIGRQELRQRLMESHPDRFAAAVPQTSRPKRDNEVDGREYCFVPRNVFEQDVLENKFVEYGEYEKHFFGTSMESIRQVVNSGKICILNFHPQSLRLLKASDVKPYFVFIAPPNIEKLKQLRQKQCVKVTDDELKMIIEKARKMEEEFGHYFDMIIVNQDVDRSYDELLAELNRLELEPQWVTIQWMT